MPRRGRPRKGTIRQLPDGRFEYSVKYTDRFGKEHRPQRVAPTKRAAEAALKDLLAEIDRALAGPNSELGSERTIGSVIEWYRKNFVRDAEYHNGVRVAGRLDARTFRLHLKTIEKFFGKMRLGDVGYNDLVNFKLARLRTPIVTKNKTRPRSFAFVHRELATFRTVLNAAKRQGWLDRNPFESGPPLIQASLEKRRDRILTREEEVRLISEAAEHLKPILFFLLDTGCRKGEMLALKWSDVDMEKGMLRFVSYKGNGYKERFVAMTQRLRGSLEMIRLHLEFVPRPEERVFNLTTFRTAFTAACRRAKIPDLRIHDLRHTAATRMAEVLSLAQLGNLLGHSNPATTARYVNTEDENRKRGAAVLDEFNQLTEREFEKSKG